MFGKKVCYVGQTFCVVPWWQMNATLQTNKQKTVACKVIIISQLIKPPSYKGHMIKNIKKKFKI